MFRDRLLLTCFVVSLLINAGFVYAVGNSEIFRKDRVIQTLRAQEIKVFKPAVPEKPKPKPKTPPPQPAKQPPPQPAKQPPPQPAKQPPPRQTAQVPPPRQQPVVINRRPPPNPTRQPPKSVQDRSSTPRAGGNPDPIAPAATGSVSSQGTIAVNPSGGSTGGVTDTTDPARGRVQQGRPEPPPEPPPPPPPVQVARIPPPLPPPVVRPEPKPEPRHEPKPEPKPEPKIENRLADRQTPEPIGGWRNPRIQEIDPDSLSNATVIIAWVVDENGRATRIRVKQSSGNREIDNACRDAIGSMRFRPAVQDGEPRDAPMERRFRIG